MKHRRRKISPEEQEKIIELYKQGKTIAETGKIMGITDNTLISFNARKGIRVSDYKPDTVDKQAINAIVEMLSTSDITCAEISRKLGLCHKSVVRIAKQKGFDVSKRRNRVWNDEMQDELEKLILEGLDKKEIADKLNRTLKAIKCRLDVVWGCQDTNKVREIIKEEREYYQ